MYVRTVRDGVPHVVYYRKDLQLSFVWTGNLAAPIEVEHGGYGEPVIAIIALDPDGSDLLDLGLLEGFWAICDQWADRWGGDTRPLDQRTSH